MNKEIELGYLMGDTYWMIHVGRGGNSDMYYIGWLPWHTPGNKHIITQL